MNIVKKLIMGAAVVTAASSFTSCSLLDFFKGGDDKIEYVAVKEDKDGDWGFVNSKGEMILKEEFKEMPTNVVNGFFNVRNEDGVTIYKFDDKKPEPLKDCEDLSAAGRFSDGLCPIVKPKQNIEIVNDKGEVQFTLSTVKNEHVAKTGMSYHDGMLRFSTEKDKWGFYDTKGEIAIAPQYDYAYDFAEGYAIAIKKKDDEVKGIVIDKKGEEVFSLKKGMQTFKTGFTGGHIFVRDEEDRCGYYDTKGEYTKLPAKVERIAAVGGDLFAFVQNNQYGVMNLEGEIIVRAKYTDVQFLDNGDILAVKDNSKAVLLDSKGEEKAELDDFSSVYVIPGFGAFGLDKNEFVMIDEKGEAVKGAEFGDINYWDGVDTGDDDLIYSDYFSIDGMAEKIASEIGANSLGIHKFGEHFSAPSGINPENLAWQNRIEIGDLSLKGFRWYANAYALYNYNVARYNYPYGYIWDTNAMIVNFQIKIYAETTLGLEGLDALAKAIQKKGYTVVMKPENKDASRYCYLLRNGITYMILYCDKDASYINIEYSDRYEDINYVRNWVENHNR